MVSIFFTACKSNSSENKIDENALNEKLTRMNKIIVTNESKDIDDFITRHSFHMTMTGTGLRYEIYKHGNGVHPVAKDEVKIDYKIFLLDGTLCYTNESAGPVNFRLGEGNQVKGLEEAIMLMVPGDRAHLILPAHLAYGMAGDQKKIPPSTALFYDVGLLNVNK
jgi:FKBP-type peptidyl-prolyl cis-trans isomerase FkpA